MDPGPLRDALTVALGVATGAMSGLFGIGGAVISTPGIRALGASAQTAIGTTLPSIIPGAASGTLRYAREGLVDGQAVRATTPVGIVTAVAGALLTEVIPGEGHALMLVTAALLAVSGGRMIRNADADAQAPSVSPAGTAGRTTTPAGKPTWCPATSWWGWATGPTVGRRRSAWRLSARSRASCRACWASEAAR